MIFGDFGPSEASSEAAGQGPLGAGGARACRGTLAKPGEVGGHGVGVVGVPLYCVGRQLQPGSRPGWSPGYLQPREGGVPRLYQPREGAPRLYQPREGGSLSCMFFDRFFTPKNLLIIRNWVGM